MKSLLIRMFLANAFGNQETVSGNQVWVDGFRALDGTMKFYVPTAEWMLAQETGGFGDPAISFNSSKKMGDISVLMNEVANGELSNVSLLDHNSYMNMYSTTSYPFYFNSMVHAALDLYEIPYSEVPSSYDTQIHKGYSVPIIFSLTETDRDGNPFERVYCLYAERQMLFAAPGVTVDPAFEPAYFHLLQFEVDGSYQPLSNVLQYWDVNTTLNSSPLAEQTNYLFPAAEVVEPEPEPEVPVSEPVVSNTAKYVGSAVLGFAIGKLVQ